MFLKSLQISNVNGVIRQINFRPGLNLIVDETPSGNSEATGNNVGKTTTLMLIDFCLGASQKGVYADPEDKKSEYFLVKEFLINTEVLITLILSDDLKNPFANELVLERNFLPRKKLIRRINGIQKTEDEFDEALTNYFFPGHYGKKPTFSQIISHNFRYKDISLTHTLHTLSAFTRDDEYETLHLFLLGCNFDRGDLRQNLLTQVRIENAFKSRLESLQPKSSYEMSLALLMGDIEKLNEKKLSLKVNPDFELELEKLDGIKSQISRTSSAISKLALRRDLIVEATKEISSSKSQVDLDQLRRLYDDVSGLLSKVHRSFAELTDFHNRMIDEKAQYISKELPEIDLKIKELRESLKVDLEAERLLATSISNGGSFEELESLINELNEKHRQKGQYEGVISQIESSEEKLKNLNEQLATIDDSLFSVDFESTVRSQLNKFNLIFAEISKNLYGERYLIDFEIIRSRLNQRLYKFKSFNENISSGKKQGEISCFDIAYTLFADQENIPCLHFLLNDKKELMHDNQLYKISKLIEREDDHVQFVASILRDKLPAELNNEDFFVLKLSQQSKLFDIEAAD